MLHDAAGRIGKALLVSSAGTPKSRLYLRARLGLPSGWRGRRSSPDCARARYPLPLARFQARLRSPDHSQTRFAPLNLRWNVQLRFETLSCISFFGALEQGINLLPQLGLRLHHAPVAHRLVTAGVGLDLGAVHSNRAQFDQPAFAGELDHLYKQIRQFLRCKARKSLSVRCAGKLPAPSTRNATSSCSFLASLREENTPVA